MKQHHIFKRTLACALVIIMALTSAPLSGFVGLELPDLFETKASALELADKNYVYTVKNGKATITKGTIALNGKVSIPAKLGGYPVTKIGSYAFAENTGLTSITIPDSVTIIESGAFIYCPGLTKVVLSNKLKSIGEWAFNSCSGLTGITIPDSVTSIGDYAFSGCKKLKNIKHSANIEYLGREVFDNTPWIEAQPSGNIYIGKVYYKYNGEMPKNTSVTIKNGTKAIASGAFESCAGLIKVTIPDSVTNIGESAFSDCTSLKSVTIPNSVKSIEAYVFSDCTGLTSIKIPAGVKSLGYGAFYGCTGLTSFSIPGSVTSIEGYVFHGCTGIKSIKIPTGVKSLEYGVFSGCTSLTSITIPGSVTSIGGSAFRGCTGLTSIKIPDGVKSLGNGAFSGCTGLTSIKIPDGVRSIDYSAFGECAQLTNITIGKNVNSIDSGAFRACTKLKKISVSENNKFYSSKDGVLFDRNKSILISYAAGRPGSNYTIPDSVKTIGDAAFNACNALESVVIPKSVKSIGYDAFNGCENLKSISIPGTVTTIGDRAFQLCSNLEKAVISKGVRSIGQNAFSDCEKLKSVSLPATITMIGDEVFHSCTGLKSVVIPSGLNAIPTSAFEYCTALNSVSFPKSVTEIGDYAFYGCTNLKSITITDSVIRIGSSAFKDTAYYKSKSNGVYYVGKFACGYKGDMAKNTKITLKDGTKGIAENAFGYCDNLVDIKVPDSVLYIGDYALAGTSWYNNQPDGMVYVGKVAYEYKGYKQEKTISIKEGTKAISGNALDHSEVTLLKIPSSVSYIDTNVFTYCYDLKKVEIASGNKVYSSKNGDVFNKAKTTLIWKAHNEITKYEIPAGVTTIGDYAFCGCYDLKSVKLPSSVKSIGVRAFDDCRNLESINIPSGVTSIGDDAFNCCYDLNDITIPKSVTYIGANAFDYSTVIKGYKGSYAISYAMANDLPYAFVDGTDAENTVKGTEASGFSWSLNKKTGVLKISGKGKMPDPETTDLKWKEQQAYVRKVILSSGITSISNGMFSGYPMEEISIPEGVTEIGDYACSYSSLKKVSIPDSCKKLGSYSFGRCENIKSIAIGSGLKNIETDTFERLFGLEKITVDKDNKYFCVIGGALLDKAKTEIYAYPLASSAKTFSIPNGVKAIRYFTFYRSQNLETLNIPASVTNIELDSAGEASAVNPLNIWNLKEFNVDSKNPVYSSVGGVLFYKGKKILVKYPAAKADKTYAIPDGVEVIGPGAFTTKYLKNVVIPKSVKTMRLNAFNSTSLKNVYYTGTQKQFEKIHFYECPAFYYADFHYNHTHTYKTTTTKATTTKDGKVVTACKVCGNVSKLTKIYKASSVKLSKTSYTYNGKVQKPTVIVKNSKGTTLKNGTDYTVSYASGCKNTGKYAVKITFKGNYSGSKTLYFNILPSKTSKLSVSQTTSSIKATWKAVTGATGYKVTLYNAKGKAVKTVDTTKTTYTFTKLSKGTTYKVRVTAYKTIDGKKVSSSVYTQLTTATKPGTPTLKVKAGAKKASLSWNKQTGASGYVVYMATSKNGTYKKIATVKGSTKVSCTKTGLTKGKTYYFKVKAYKTVDGKNIYGAYSAVKSGKIK
ncbi:MAG: leucine-rich repeat protein [Oscillospiraceae bacterium]